MENITEMETDRVGQETENEEQSLDNVMETDKQIETEQQSLDNATDDKNPKETVGQDDPESEHKDSPSPMVTEEGTNDDDPPKIDDEKNSQLEANRHPSPPPSVEDTLEQSIASNKVSSDVLRNDRDSVMVDEDTAVVHEETTTVPLSEDKGSPRHHASNVMEQEKPAEEDDMTSSGEQNEIAVTPDTKLSEDKGSPLHTADTAMEQQDRTEEEYDMTSSGNHTEVALSPDTKLSEDKGSPLHTADTVMEQQDRTEEEHDMTSSGDHTEIALSPDTKLSEDKGSPLHHAQDKTAEEHDMTSSGEHKEFPVIPDTKLSEDKGSPLHLANTVTEQDKTAEEDAIISSGEQKEFLVNPDTKVSEENNDEVDEGEANNMNLADDGSRPVDHDQGTTTEVEKGLEVPGSETVSNLEDNKPSEPLIEPPANLEKEPVMPATENDKLSDILAPGVSGDSDKGLSLLPATQTSSDHNEGVSTLEAEPIEDMELDVPDSKLVTDAGIDSANNNDVNVDAPNAEEKDYSIVLVPERSDADNENASVRLEPGLPCVVSSDTKGLSRGLNNGVHKIGQPPSGFDGTMSANQAAPGCDGTMSAKRSFLLDDASDGNESGTEEDQSAFMKELYQFFRERSMDFKPPKFYGEGLNCLK